MMSKREVTQLQREMADDDNKADANLDQADQQEVVNNKQYGDKEGGDEEPEKIEEAKVVQPAKSDEKVAVEDELTDIQNQLVIKTVKDQVFNFFENQEMDEEQVFEYMTRVNEVSGENSEEIKHKLKMLYLFGSTDFNENLESLKAGN